MADVPLFRGHMATVTSRENTLYRGILFVFVEIEQLHGKYLLQEL